MPEILPVAALHSLALTVKLIFKHLSDVSEDSSGNKHIHVHRKLIPEELVHLLPGLAGNMYNAPFVIHESHLKVRAAKQGEWYAVQITCLLYTSDAADE